MCQPKYILLHYLSIRLLYGITTFQLIYYICNNKRFMLNKTYQDTVSCECLIEINICLLLYPFKRRKRTQKTAFFHILLDFLKNNICHCHVTNAPKGMGLACDTYMESYLTMLDRLIILELRPGQGHSNPETKHQTLQPQDVSTYQIWESHLK